jgi:MFS family permease
VGVVSTYRRLLGNGPLSRLLLGEFVSLVGDRMYLVALLVLIYRETHDAAVLAVVGAVRLVPYLLLSIPAGVVADRFDRRYVLLMSDIGRGICMLVLAALVVTGGSVVAIGATALVAGSFTPFFHPAFRALVPSLVRDESEFGPTNSAWSTLDSLSMVIGPALAGFVIAVASVEVAFLLNAATYALVAVILLSLAPAKARPIEQSVPSPVDPLARRGARLRDVVNLPAVAGVLSLEAVAGMAFGALDILAVILAIDVFRGGDAATGYLTAAMGVGGVVGSLAAGVIVLRPRLRPPIIGSVGTISAALVLLGVAPNLGIAFLAIMLLASGNMVLEVMRSTIFQRAVPDAYRGRFGGLLMTNGVGAEALGVLVVPILAAGLGLAFVLDMLALGTIAATAVGLILIGTVANQDSAQPPVAVGADRAIA